MVYQPFGLVVFYVINIEAYLMINPVYVYIEYL